MRAYHLRKWLREHREKESTAEAEDEGVMSEVGGRKRGTDTRRKIGEVGRAQNKW